MSQTRPRTVRLLGAGLLAVVLGVVSLAVAPSASAASCAATIHIRGQVGITLQPASVTVDRGSCVIIRNEMQAGQTVHVTVAPGFAKDVPAGGSVAYPAGVSGKHAVHASYVLSDASGAITVRPPAPAPSHSPSPVSSPVSQPSSSGTGPQVAPGAPTPSPARSLPGSVVGPGRPPGPRNPSVAQPPVPVTVPAPPPAPPAVVAGPIEAASARGAGLPAAIAALALVGTAAALVRVLLVVTDGPVDTRRNVVAGP